MSDLGKQIYDRVAFLLDEVDMRLDEGEPDDGLQLAVQAHRLLERYPEHATVDLKIDTHYLLAACNFEMGLVADALGHYDVVRTLDPKDPEIDYWQARALFHSWRFDDAERLLRKYQGEHAAHPGTLYYRALLADFRGQEKEAESLFDRAAAENPEEFARPIRLPAGDVQHMLEDVLASLPVHVRGALENVDVRLVRLPDPKIHASPDVDPLILGLYRGSSLLGSDAFSQPTDLDRIEVFQRNVERVVADSDELREELRITLLHEIGHHLGWDEDDLTQRGLN